MNRQIRMVIVAGLLTVLAACGESKKEAKAPTLRDATPAVATDAVKKAPVEKTREVADKSTPLESYKTLNSGDQIMYAYLGLSGMPIDYPAIARKVSKEYSSSGDEFRKNDLLTALKPKIDAAVGEAKKQRYWKISIDEPIEKYDFERKGFPLSSSVAGEGSYRYFNENSEYRLAFTNGSKFKTLTNISEDTARRIEGLRSQYGKLELVVYCFAQDTAVSATTVNAEIVKVVLATKAGEVLIQM